VSIFPFLMARAALATTAVVPVDGASAVPAGRSLLNRMLAATNDQAEVYEVTSLSSNPSTPGTLGHAVSTGDGSVTRIVTFAVSGVIAGASEDADVLVFDRPNVWVAGQTAPDPGDGSGRGITIRPGRVTVREGNIVVDHLRVRSVINNVVDYTNRDDQSAQIIAWKVRPSSPVSHNVFRNLTVLNAQADEAFSVGPNTATDTSTHFVTQNCIIGEHVRLGGTNDQELWDAYPIYHWRGAFQALYYGNLVAAGFYRMPGQRNPSGAAYWSNMIYGWSNENQPGRAVNGNGDFICDLVNNYAEYGPDTPDTQNSDIFALGPLSGGDDNVVKYARDNIKVTPSATIDPTGEQSASGGPYYLEPEVTVSVDAVKAHAFAHAGSWPAQRDAGDQRIVDQITAGTYALSNHTVGVPPNDVQVSTVTGQSPAVPANPFADNGTGVTNIEQWLHDLHVAAGGADNFVAGEWWNAATV